MRDEASDFLEFVASFRAGRHSDLELIRQSIENARARSEELAEAIRYCAIPRRFDARIIGVLRGKAKDAEGNSRLLADVIGHTFVLARPAGRFVYHDNVRDALLKDWQTPENLAKFERLNGLLVEHFDAEQRLLDELDLAFASVADLLKKGNIERYAQILSDLDERRLAPMLEALYHAMLQSANTGLNKFEEHYFSCEGAGRLGACDALVRAAVDHLGRYPDADAARTPLLWMRYYEARLARRTNSLDKAESILRE